MADGEEVVGALLRRWEPAEARPLAERAEPPAAAGEYLVRVALVPHVPEQPVACEVKRVVQRDGQLGHSEIARQVPAVGGDHLDDPPAKLLSQPRELRHLQPTKLVRRGDPIQ